MSKYKKLELTLGKKYDISNSGDISYIIPIRYMKKHIWAYDMNNKPSYRPARYYCHVSYLDGKSCFMVIRTSHLRKYIKNT